MAKPSELETHLGYWLRFVSNHVSQAFARKIEARGVTVAEWALMRVLFEADGAPPSVVAERMGMTRGAITKLVDRLSDKDLVARGAGTGDQRTQSLALTRAGRALVPELAALADKNDAEFFGHLKPTQRAALETALKDIVRRQSLKTIPTS
jgi:DNA-binding MarR family transcriptional regulator